MSKMAKLLFVATGVSVLALWTLGKPEQFFGAYAVIGPDDEGVDLVGEGVVGRKAWCETPDGAEFVLRFSPNLDPESTENPADDGIKWYLGKGRCLDDRFDFWFEDPGYDPSGTTYAIYRLYVRLGVYDHPSDTIFFTGSPAGLVRYIYNGAGEPIDWDEIYPERIANFSIKLFPLDEGGDETQAENTVGRCKDDIDNDGDGLKDCADPDCQGTKACR